MFIALSLSEDVFIMLLNVTMPTVVCILTILSMIHLMLSWVEHENKFTTSGTGGLILSASVSADDKSCH